MGFGGGGRVAGILAAALLREVRWRQYGGGGSAVAVAVRRRWQRGGDGIAAAAAWQRRRQRKKCSGQHGASAEAAEGAPAAKTAAWPQPWGRWRQAWRQLGVGGGVSAVRVRVRSYSIFNMCDILSR